MPDNKEREVRLGLVLFGGVSLAVYMNGVAEEFYNAVRGRGLYGEIKDALGADIVVDIVSGTSAGGINGIFLAYALANNCEFSACADLWRKKGGFESLLRKPSAGPCESVFDSEGYYLVELEKAFAEMRNTPASADPEYPSAVSELDLFVTGTDFHGDQRSEFDDAGNKIDVLDHRALFKLKYRAGRANDFAAENEPALAKLATLTSAFPVAFTPVTVDGGNGGPDALLRRWGKFKGRKHFVDGGVLDNKPFTPTIGAIYNRTADRPVDRFLCYVEPDPKELLEEKKPLLRPNAKRAAWGALTSLPWYESIGGDLRDIAQHNSEVARYARLCENISSQVLEGPPRQTLNPWCVADPFYRRARLLSLADRAVEGIVQEKAGLSDDDRRDAAKRLYRAFEGWGAHADAQEAAATLEPFDVYFRRRRVFRTIDSIYRLLASATPPPDAELYRDVWRRLNRHWKMLEVVQFAMEALIDEGDFAWERAVSDGYDIAGSLWADVAGRLGALLEAGDDIDPKDYASDDLTAVRDAFGERLRRLKAGPVNAPAPAQSILTVTDGHERRMLAGLLRNDDAIYLTYSRFAEIDERLFPAEMVSGLREKNPIRVVRFSPLDAKQGLSEATTKVQGRKFGHFAAFLKESWRANDILWGRLDGACQIIDLLMRDSRWDGRREGYIARAQHEILKKEFAPEAYQGYADVEDYFKRGYTVQHETWRTLAKAAAIPVAVTALAVLALPGVGVLWRGRPRE
jgi:patatin-related protein